MYSLLGLNFEYYIEKDMHGHNYHKIFMLSTNTDKTNNKMFVSLIKEYNRIEDQMKKSRFCFKFRKLLNIRSEKVNFQGKHHLLGYLTG